MGNDFKRGIRVYLETSDYGKGINEMVASTQKYEKELNKLIDESKKMTAAGKDSGKLWDDLQRKIKAHEKQLIKSQQTEADYRAKLQQTEKVLKNLSGASYDELIAVQKRLSVEVKKASRDTDKHKIALEQYNRVTKEVNKAQGEMNSKIGTSGGFFSRMANGFNKYFNVTVAFIAGVTGMSLAFRKVAEDVAHMDDVYSDVMKTTGLTREQVEGLNAEIKKMDTRTSREDLNKLATEAGKLGIEGTKNILDFVDAGNQIKVALGEDLGEDAIKSVGKMVGVFQNSTKQLQGIGLKEQMLAVGSAINQLGASSSASEDYLVQFAGRLGGVSKQANISMASILGFASALDQDMQQVEMSATALQQFIMKLMGDPAKFAKLAGLNVKEFVSLLNVDTNAAIKKVLTALNDKGGFAALIPIFQEMGLDGARATGVLSAMAGSIDKIDAAQKIANQSMAEGTSITNEYNTKNENLAAKLDKAKKAFFETSLELGSKLNPILLKSVSGTTYLVKGLVALPKWLKENSGLIIKLSAAVAAYALAMNLSTLNSLRKIAVEKAEQIIHTAKLIGLRIRIALTNQATAAELRLVGSQKALNTAMKENIWGLIASGIAIALVYLIDWYNKTKQANVANEIFNARMADQKELIEQHSKAVLDEKQNLESLVNAIIQTNDNTALRNKLIGQLKEQYPGFISFIKTENVTNQMLYAALKDVNDQYSIRIKNAALLGKAESFDNASVKAEQRRIEIEEEIKKLSKENTEDAAKRIKELNKEDRQLQRNILAYQQHSSNYRTEAQKNDQEVKRMNTAEYAQSQIKVWYDAAKDFETKYREARNNGLTEQAAYYQKQMQKANNYVKFYMKKRDELAKIEKQNTTTTTTPNKTNNIVVKEDDKAYENSLKKRENTYKESQLELMDLRRTGDLTEETYNQIALQTQLIFLQDKKALQEKFGKETIDTELEISSQKTKINEASDAAILKSTKQLQDSGLLALQSGEDTKLIMLKEALAKQKITQDDYDLEIKRMARDSSEAKLALAEASYKMLEKADFKNAETQKTALDEAKKQIEKLKNDLIAAGIEFEAEVRKPGKSIADTMSEIFGDNFSKIGDMFTVFSENLDKLKKGDLASWTDWGQAIGGIVQSSIAVAQQISDEYFSYKANALEADKQRELTAAGDNATKREEINRKYLQKELDLKKKQSTADTVLKIAQIGTSTALAVMQAFAQLGPVGGAIAALLIGTVSGFQIASALKQNSAIQNTTLDSSVSGSADAPQATGTRVAQAADGRYDVIGQQDGKTYRNIPYRGVARTGLVTTPTLVGEAGSEVIIDNPTLRNIHMNAPYVIDIINRNRVPQRASGNYSSIDNGMPGTSASSVNDNSSLIIANIEVMKEMIALLRYLKENGVDAWVLLSDLEKQQILSAKSKKKGSPK